MDFYDMNDFIPHYDISVEELSEDINETLELFNHYKESGREVR